MQSLSKSQIFFLVEIGKKTVLKFIWTLKEPLVAKIILTKSKAGGLTFPDWKAIIIIIEGYWHKDEDIDQWNRLDTLEIKPHMYPKFNKGT